jgi:hypothetical protein
MTFPAKSTRRMRVHFPISLSLKSKDFETTVQHLFRSGGVSVPASGGTRGLGRRSGEVT